MGKSKKRILHKGINDKFSTLSREGAITEVVGALNTKRLDADAKDLISLFGLSAEELLEGGALYEDIIGIRAILN